MIAAANDLSSVFVWSFVLIAAVIAGFILVAWAKRRLKADDEPAAPAGFTLADLREMHRAGQITTEEFERARSKMVAGLKQGPTGQARR
jgi:hypothetical protein